MKAQSSYSSWYFIERATIGDIRINCTIALTSQILNSGRRPTAEPAEKNNSLFGKAIGADWHASGLPCNRDALAVACPAEICWGFERLAAWSNKFVK